MATTPIRPPLVPPGLAGQGPPRADAAKLAAQRAFFDMAMGRAAPAEAAAPAAATAAPSAAPSAPASPRPVAAQLPSEPPQKILRPGSILDIRV